MPGTPGFTGATLNRANITRSSPGKFDDDQFTISLDKSIGQNDKLTGRWFWSEFTDVKPFGGGSTLAFQRTTPNLNRFLKLGWTRTLSSRAVNQLRFGFNRFGFGFAPVEPITLADIGATRANSGEFPAAYRIAIAGVGFSLGTGVNDNRGGRFNTFVYADDFSYSLDKHLVRAGFEASQYQLNRFNNFGTRGSVTFGNTTAGQGGVATALVGFQNFLLGRITTTQGRAGFSTFHFRALDYAAYIQDDWRASDSLTINLGLRWEGLSVAREKDNFLSNFRGLNDDTQGPLEIIHPAATPKVGTPGVTSCTMLECLDDNNWAPRVGFALDLGGQKTVLRGGYGIYYQRVSNQPLLQTSGGIPFAEDFSASAFSVTTVNPFPEIKPSSAFPLPADESIPRLTGFNGTTGAPIFGSASGGPASGFRFFPSRDFHAPYSQQWNLNIQREVARGWVAEAGYVGTRGIDLLGPGRPFNASQICTVGNPCAIPGRIGASVTVPAGTPGIEKRADGTILITQSTDVNQNARVPFQFLGLATSRGFFQEQASQSTYHGLQTTLSHQYANGLYLQGAYTYSKSMDNASGSSFTDELNGLVQYGSLFDTHSGIGLSDFDRTHRLVVSYNYELPFARWAGVEDRGFGRVAHGWSINGVTVYQSGTPFMFIDSSAVTLEDTGFVNTTNKTILTSGNLKGTLTSGDVRKRLDNYVDTTKFLVGGECVNNQNQVVPASSAACTGFTRIGDVGRNQLRGPFQSNWDLSIVKTTKITERTSIDFRTEFFNVWNHASFQSPQAQGGPQGNFGTIDVSTGDSSILATVNRPRIIQFAAKINF
ncbi:MAG: TonB-dependent receptor [Acidobacteria bacterium]|nr:TonB-dependent receptor [Acidobacteriota bacterium]